MDREDVRFYCFAVGFGAAGTIVGGLLGWEGTGFFMAGMGPVTVVMLVFMLRERRAERLDQKLPPAAQHRT